MAPILVLLSSHRPPPTGLASRPDSHTGLAPSIITLGGPRPHSTSQGCRTGKSRMQLSAAGSAVCVLAPNIGSGPIQTPRPTAVPHRTQATVLLFCTASPGVCSTSVLLSCRTSPGVCSTSVLLSCTTSPWICSISVLLSCTTPPGVCITSVLLSCTTSPGYAVLVYCCPARHHRGMQY